MATALVKQMTGGTDEIKARFFYQDYFSFRPQFKIFLGTNFLPKVQQHDDAMWERMKRIPFVVQIPLEERDYDLEETLQRELPGILAWAVEGCKAWLAGGRLVQPTAVTEATAEYRGSMDPVAPFLEECCTLGDPSIVKTKASLLWNTFKKWSGHSPDTAMNMRGFLVNLEQKGFERKQGAGNYFYWHGIGVVNTDDERYS